MTYKLKISSQYQVTIPRDLVLELGLKPGSYIVINPDQGDYKIQNTRKKVASLYGSLGRLVKDKTRLLKSEEEFEKVLENSKLDHFKSNQI